MRDDDLPADLPADPWHPDSYPCRGVLYVQREDGSLTRFNVAVAQHLANPDTDRITIYGLSLGRPVTVPTASSYRPDSPTDQIDD